MARLALLALLSSLCLALARAYSANEAVPLTLAAGACTGLEIDGLGQKFSYTAILDSVSLGSGCNQSSISLSKLYVEDACISNRDNSLGLSSVQDVTCSKASDSSTATCTAVFQNGGSSNLVSAGNLTAGQDFDSGDVCSNQNTGFVYVQNTCTSESTVTITVNKGSYNGLVCASVDGHELSAWAIAIICVAGVLALLIFFWVLACCCCKLTCCCL